MPQCGDRTVTGTADGRSVSNVSTTKAQNRKPASSPLTTTRRPCRTRHRHKVRLSGSLPICTKYAALMDSALYALRGPISPVCHSRTVRKKVVNRIATKNHSFQCAFSCALSQRKFQRPIGQVMFARRLDNRHPIYIAPHGGAIDVRWKPLGIRFRNGLDDHRE